MQLIMLDKLHLKNWSEIVIPFRFFQHYRFETIHFIRRKIIPTATIPEISEIIFHYSKNSSEKGEILNIGDIAFNLFEDLVKRVVSELE